MKVLFIVTAYPRHSGDVITPWMSETIRRLAARAIKVEVLAPAYRGLGSQVVDGVRVHRFRYAPRGWETLTHDQTAPDRIREQPLSLALVPGYVAAATVAAVRLARSGQFDVLHAFWPLPHGLVGLAAKRASGVPLVSTFFGVELTWMESQFPVLAPALKLIARGSDAVTAISTYTAGKLVDAVPGVQPVIIPFGATVEPGSEQEARAALQGGVGNFELLFVGRLVERKGLHILLDALALLESVLPWRLHIVGDGPQGPALQDQTQRLGLAKRVVFDGFVMKQTLAERFAACDVFVLPAVVDAKGDTEGLGVVLLEAMSYGKPVIASAAGGIVDIVRNGENGLLVPPEDAPALATALERMATDEAERRRMGARGRQRVRERFSWDVVVARLADVYRRVQRSEDESRGSRRQPRKSSS